MINFPGFDKDTFLVLQEPDPRKRDKNYYLQNVRAFYSEYLKNISTIGIDGGTRYEVLKSFAEGRQLVYTAPTVQRSNLLDVHGNAIEYNTAELPTIDPNHEVWDVLSPANKIMSALIGTLMKIEYEVNADPLDYATKHETEQAKLDRWVYAKNAKKIQLAASVAGINYPEPDFIPESPEDLDQNTQEFLPQHVRFVEQIVKHSFDISHWTPDTKMLFYRDLFINHIACIKNEYDPEDGKVKPMYISPKMGDIQKSQWMDCRDSERGWHFTLMSITTLRQYFKDKPEEWFEKVAGTYAGMFDNPAASVFERYREQTPRGGYGYDAYKVVVGHFEWIDINTSKETISYKRGRKVVKEVPLDAAVESDKIVRFADERMRFQCKWVIGSDDIFEYGPAYEVTHPTKNDTELTYQWIVMPGKSPIEQLIPIFKNFQDLWDKYRELLRNSQGKIQFIDVDMLASTAGQKDDPNTAAKKSFQRFLSTNKLLFRRINAAGMPNQNRPVEELDGGMGSLFSEIQAAFQLNISLVEYITGYNPLALGQSADPNAPVTTSEMSMNATSNTIRPMVEAYMRMVQGISENLVRWTSILIRGNEYSRAAYKDVIGEEGIQCIIAANKSEADYGIKLTARPDELEKQWLLNNLNMAVTPQGGAPREISTADGNLILNMIASGEPIKTIQFFFEKARKRQRAADLAEKKAIMQQQSELNQKDSALAAQNAKDLDAQRHQQAMDQIAAKNQGVVENTATQEQLRKEKEEAVQHIKNEGASQKTAAA